MLDKQARTLSEIIMKIVLVPPNVDSMATALTRTQKLM